MKILIGTRPAGTILLTSFGLLVIFFLVLAQVIPSDIVWGGQAAGSSANMQILELVSLLVKVAFILIAAIKMDYIHADQFKRASAVGVWVIFFYLVLNTIGHLASAVSFENVIFALITILMAILAFRLASEKL